jgi:uncharacterized protein YjbJ (UPF0337 family)
MNWDNDRGQLEAISGQARQQWGKLTDDDWELVAGKRDELAGRIQERYGIAKDEAERQVDEWSSSSDLATAKMSGSSPLITHVMATG